MEIIQEIIYITQSGQMQCVMGNKYLYSNHTLNNIALSHSNREREVGVRVTSDLRVRNCCFTARNHTALRFISRNVSNKGAKALLIISGTPQALVRLRCSGFDSFESAHSRTTKDFRGFRNLLYIRKYKAWLPFARDTACVDLLKLYQLIKGTDTYYLLLKLKGDTRTHKRKV